MVLSLWNKQLKVALIRATFYFRFSELGLDPYQARAFATLDLAHPHSFTALGSSLSSFFLAREEDFERPHERGSSFLLDASTLFAEIEQPNLIFLGFAKETARRTIGRLVRVHGMRASEGNYAIWLEAVQGVGESMPLEERAARYRELFEKLWETDLTFADQGILGKSSKLWPKHIFDHAYEWGDSIGFP